MSAVAAPADRRFRRALVKPSRKRRDWRAQVARFIPYSLVVLGVAYGVYRGSGVAAHARVLQIDRILVRGNERLSHDEVLSLVNGLRGESLLWTDLDGWRHRLLGSPWVRDVALRRSLPSTIEVTVSERQPAMLGRINGETYLIDDRGAVLDRYGPRYADVDLPLVDGLAAASSQSGSSANEARAELATRVIAALKPAPEIAKRLSQIDVSDLHNVTAILSGDPAVIELGDDRFLGRLESYFEVVGTLRERVPAIDHVDLRFDNRIYVRSAGTHARSGVIAAAVHAAPARRRTVAGTRHKRTHPRR
jgi:cell division protein FtsQ